MAEAAVIASFIGVLINKLDSAVWDELGSLWGAKDDFKKLQRLLSTIRAVLDEGGRRSTSDVALRKWLKDLKDVALDADDVVDEFQADALMRKKKKKKVHKLHTGQVCSFFPSHVSSVGYRFKMARKIKGVISRFNELAEERYLFHLADTSISEQHVVDRETYSFVVESTVYGRNDDKERVMNFLTDQDDNIDVSILSLVGLGGVGKTTVAQLVYNDERIKEHFDLLMWVCVGEDFDVKRIAKAIAEYAMKGECSYSDFDSIQQLVRQQLEDKKFLLVLDDVWCEEPMEWERLKPLLRGCKRGNKIIVTTRSEIVARIMSTVDAPYRLENLSVDDCWILFKQMAFGPGRAEETPKLVEIGKEIVSKCGGLPLAAKALGSLMASRHGEAEWMDVKNSEIWRLPGGKNEILPALWLSYEHLPLHLKQCFAYCKLFPKGHRIDRLKLIQLWIAEGLIQSSASDVCEEDIGNRYFNSLLWRSFFQDEERDDFGNIVSCRMHDLVHDLACYVAPDDYTIIDVARERSGPSGCRCYSIVWDNNFSSAALKFGCGAKKVRSLILIGEAFNVMPDIEKSVTDTISSLTSLRVLHLSGIRICNLPTTMARLKYLRFLDLSFTDIATVPDFIASMHNLQILNLRHCAHLRELPEAISTMSNLRHLDISACGLTRMPSGLGRLHGLQTLPLFIIGEEPGHTIAELQHLNLVRGELTIKCLCNVQDPVEAVEAKLRAKTNLQWLELCWDINEFWSEKLLPSRSTIMEELVIENLRPPHNLMFLRIDKYAGSICPAWLRKTDPSSPFSSLKVLELLNLPNLTEWSLRAEMFPCLQKLAIRRCPKLTIDSHMTSSILELEVRGSNEELFAAPGSLQGLLKLRKLEMTHIKLSTSEWEGLRYLTTVQELTIGWCSELISLPHRIMQQHFPFLGTLKLNGNLELTSLGEGGEGGRVPPPFFTALHHLIISDCGLSALPVWLGGLSSLQSLTLQFCHSLAMLPDELQCLTGLSHLTVDNCRLLRRRCDRETGEDWHKIAHIPNVKIINVLYL